MSESKQYEISTQTIKDIIDKVPQERWNDCLEEMKVALAQVAAVVEAIGVAAASMGINPSDAIQYPETIKWVDDGLNQNTVRLRNGDDGEILGELKMSTERQYTDNTQLFGEDVR